MTVLLLLAAYVAGMAQPASSRSDVTVHFRIESAKVEADYLDNAKALAELDAIVDRFRMNIDSVTVVAYSSPDGSVRYNEMLSEQRAASMVKWLKTKYADVDFKQIRQVAGGPDFSGLTSRVENDSKVPYRDDVLALIKDWGASPTATYDRLRKIRGGEPYSYIRRNYLPWMRNATTVIFHYRSDVSTYSPADTQEETVESDYVATERPALAEELPLITEEVVSQFVPQGALVTMLDNEGILPPTVASEPASSQSWTIEDPIAESHVSYPETSDEVEPKEPSKIDLTDVIPSVPYTKVPYFAATTNLAYDAVTALNFGFIIPAGDHWAITAHYMFPWWIWKGNSRAFQILHWDLGARYYLRPVLTDRATHTRTKLGGWYLSASAGIGYYDFEPNGKGWQGEEVMASIGGGYSLLLSRRWSLDFGLGVGPVFTKYRYYEGRNDHTRLVYQYKGKWSYFGPTSLNVGLTYMFYHKRKNK